METDTARLPAPTPCSGRVHRPARARGVWQRHRQAHAHDPVDDGNGPTGKITKLEHHVSGKTEPNKLETGTPMDRINRSGIGSQLGTTIQIGRAHV